MAKETGAGAFFAGFLLGGLIGAALALLFAPQPGEQTVTMLRDKGIEIKDRVEKLSPEEATTSIKKAFQDAIAEGKSAAARTKEEMMARLEQKKTEAPADEPPVTEIPLA